MQQIAIISGKGGTGKTSLTAAFASLAINTVFADCDVDAADLHILLTPDIIERNTFSGGKKAVINSVKCTDCGLCEELCRFDAISRNGILYVEEYRCEGCGLCAYACPEKAIEMLEEENSQWFISNTRFGKMVHAKLGIAQELSGKLVALIRDKARQIARENGNETILVDGPPGVGCPVISTITGIDKAVIVIEPTMSGLHDLNRVVELTTHFKVETGVIINKYDINTENLKKIEGYCKDNKIDVLGKLPYDSIFVDSQVNLQTVVEYMPDHSIVKMIHEIWKRIIS